MSFADALRAVDVEWSQLNLQRLAKAGLAEQCERAALDLVEPAAQANDDPRLWQWVGLLYRALDQHRPALSAFAHAARRAPDDAGIAHGHAQVTLEAGLDAVPLFERAVALAPTNSAALLGLGGARFAQGDGGRALADLGWLLNENPGWVEGHRQFAQLASLTGAPSRLSESLDRALAAAPDVSLIEAKFSLLIQAERFAQLLVAVQAAGASLPASDIALYRALAHSELGDIATANALFASLPEGPPSRVWRVRHLLRSGRAIEALPIVDKWLATEDAVSAWPYASAAWRLTDDPRWAWLEGDPALVAVVDLSDRMPMVADLLRDLHARSGTFADQSVRGGSQTDGPLLSRIEPAIVELRALLAQVVADYAAALPPTDPRHPLLCHRRDRPVRFAGSWSVRLGGAGHHSHHVHPQGWISSALYIAVPDAAALGDEPNAGWLSLGELQASIGLNLPPTRLVEPGPGRLVLFPSTMWHGTRPFARGERLTVAFDVAPPLP